MGKIKTYQIVIFFTTIVLLFGFIIVYGIINKTQLTSGETSSLNSSNAMTSDSSSDNLVDTPVSEMVSAQETSSEIIVPKAGHFSQIDIDYLDNLITEMGEGVSVYYEDLNSENIYTYNQEEKYFIASIIKAPYCMYLYDLASQGKCDLDEIFVFLPEDIKDGTGELKEMEFLIDEATDEPIPIELTMRELMGYAIKNSDNTAMELLRDRYNYIGYTEYAMELGLNYKEDISYIVDGQLTAKDAGIYAKSLYDFFETNEYGPELKAIMMETGNKMIATDSPMARKYGWAENSFHDMAVVYAENPYVLVILTNHDTGKREDYELFGDISLTLEKLQQEKYDEIVDD